MGAVCQKSVKTLIVEVNKSANNTTNGKSDQTGYNQQKHDLSKNGRNQNAPYNKPNQHENPRRYQIDQVRQNNHNYVVPVEKPNFTKSPKEISKIASEWKTTINTLTIKTTLRSYALSRNRRLFYNLSDLKSFITKSPATTDLEKLWVIYLWVTENIEYDFYGYINNCYKGQDANTIFSTGKSVCAGYARIFKELCDAYHVQCSIISGCAKGYGYRIGSNDLKKNHDWNLVYINNEHKIIDSTWGAGYGDPSKGFVKEFDPYHFLIPPEVSIHQRLPEEQQYQYLSKAISKSEFLMLPYYRKSYYLNGLNCLTHNSCFIEIKSNPFTIEYQVPSGVKMSGNLVLNDNKLENYVLIQRHYKTKNMIVEVSLPQVREYNLRLFCGPKDNQIMDWAVEYYIKPSLNLIKPSIEFCKTYLFPADIYLFEPKEKCLKINREYKFRVWVEAQSVALIDSSKSWTHLIKEDSNSFIWTITYRPTQKGDMQLSANVIKNSNTYSTAFMYEVSLY